MPSTTEIRGLLPADELSPADEAQLADILARANADGAVCYVAGGLSKQDWGAAPSRIDQLVSTRGLSGCSDVDPDNLTLSAAPGTTVAEARARAEAVGRILPIDPGHPGQATIGGVVATGDQGARTAGYGGLRDVVLGVRATMADGSAVKFGGRTMKNVTGYDMTKLFVGSFGALGVITEVTFRLLPGHDSQALVILPLASLEEAAGAVARVLASYLQPLALEVVSADALPPDFASSTAKLPGGRAAAAPATIGAPIGAGKPLLLAGFSGHRAAVDRSIREVSEANPTAVPQVVLRDDAAEAIYEHLTGSGPQSGGTRLGLRASVPISRVLDVVAAARDYASANGLSLGYRAGAARGRVDLLFSPGEGGAAAAEGAAAAGFGACLSQMRAQAAAMGGSMVVTGGAALLPAGYDAWGDTGASLAIMKRIKERFDPNGILNQGRFVGGYLMSTETKRGAAGVSAQADRGAAKKAAPEEFQALYDHVITCGKCGFCQPVCPIFRATGREANVARGKVALYRNMLEDRTEIGPDTKDAFANCLLCRACTESCFSAVKTDKVVISFRHAYADRFGRGMLQRGVFRFLLPRPRLMRGLVKTIWALRKTGLPDLACRAGLIGLLNPKLERAMELREGTPGPLLTSRLKRRGTAARTGPAPSGAAGGEGAAAPVVGYWMSCGYNYVLPEVGEATIAVLESLGDRVEILNNCCCGLAAYGYGDVDAAKDLARDNLRRLGDLDRFEAIVSECGSCSGHLKEYAELLADDPEWAAQAEALKKKMRSFSEFVQEKGGLPAGAEPDTVGPGGREAIVITYHEPCHMGKRYQNVSAQPRQILRSLEGYEFREAAESDSCCGAAGTYGVLHPETSGAIIDRKTGLIKDTGAVVVATECPSCMMQLAYGLKRAGIDARVVNISQLCDDQLRGRSRRAPK